LSRFSFPGRLYPILDVEAARARDGDPLALLQVWLDAGVRLVQLRAKTLETGALLELTDRAVALAGAVGASLIVNDRADVVRMAGAAGVHVGQDDLRPADARRVVGPYRLVGFSTHTDAQLEDGCGEPVDYLAMGPVFATGTKRDHAAPVGLAGVSRAAARAARAGRPLVAIGGITIATAPAVIAAGAGAVAVIGDLMSTDPAGRIRDFLKALS
jgi:thiamine-phosphate pyrophosphorylase